MIILDDKIISDDLAEIKFVCKLETCKGACCVEGDAGAPLEEKEVSALEDCIDKIKPYMTNKGREVIERFGVFDYDADGELVTPLIDDRECAYTYFIKDVAFCAIEKAWEEDKVNFRKPVSCHLFPLRITKHKSFDAINYHKWHICRSALENGRQLGVPLYKFLKDALIRRYGESWYLEFLLEIEKGK